ncbi:MAG: hypothetical protein JNK72_10260 [Myxococcales bacterium]|nr:hypothetical protein [Myxococcales bacterium]
MSHPEAPPAEAAAETTEPPVRPVAPSWRTRLGASALSGASLVFALAITVKAHLHFMLPFATPVSNDEGYISAFAMRMIDGRWLPYVDAVSQRGPILYWVTAAVMRLAGRFSWLPIRGLALSISLLLVLGCYLLARALFTPLAGGLAALFVTYFLSYELNPWDGVGLNGEGMAMVFALGSMLAVSRVMLGDDAPRVQRRLTVASGALIALAGLSKQMALAHAAPSVLWLALGRVDDDRGFKTRMRAVGAFVAGALAPYALVLGLYAATGHLREFVYYYQRYGRDIFMAPVTVTAYREKLREQIDKYFLGIAGVGSLATLYLGQTLSRTLRGPGGLGRWRREAPRYFAVAQMAFGALGACFTGRFFPHYFVQLFPVAAVVAGAAGASMLEAEGDAGTVDRPRGWLAQNIAGLVAVLGAMALLTVSASALDRVVRFRRDTDRWYQDPRADAIVRYVIEKTAPSDLIFVWGFRAETHVSSGRRPASRFVYSVYPAGVVPWFQATRDEEEQRQVPGARQQLLDDLESNRPELVIDAGRSMNGRYMYNYPVLRTYLDRNYCFMRYVDGEPIYRRRHGANCPPADY